MELRVQRCRYYAGVPACQRQCSGCAEGRQLQLPRSSWPDGYWRTARGLRLFKRRLPRRWDCLSILLTGFIGAALREYSDVVSVVFFLISRDLLAMENDPHEAALFGR